MPQMKPLMWTVSLLLLLTLFVTNMTYQSSVGAMPTKKLKMSKSTMNMKW